MVLKRTRVAAAKGGRKRRQREPEDDEGGDFHLLDDDDAAAKGDSEQEEDQQQQQETADEIRLRVAREYLDNVKAAEDEEGDDDADDAVAEHLRHEAAEAAGRVQRRIAHSLQLPPPPPEAGPYGAGQFKRAHRQTATAVCLTSDDRSAFTVGSDGSVFKWDVESMRRTQLYRPGDRRPTALQQRAADWVKPAPRQGGGAAALYAAAVSSDGKWLAVAGGDRQVHVFDAGSGQHAAAYPGHRDLVSGLAFREGGTTLFSSSFDRTVKIWSLENGMYVDTLFGHQAEVLAVDALRAERAVSGGHDRSCRVWKVPEESQLIFRAPCAAVECCRYINGTEWVSGGCDGNLQLWSQMKKKPVFVCRGAHGGGKGKGGGAAAAAAAAAAPSSGSWAVAGSDACSWVQSVAACRGSDLVASGAGDGAVRLWAVEPGKGGGAAALSPVGQLPAPGFVNGLALARSGRFLLAALGQEPRLGRWGRVAGVRAGLLLHPLGLPEGS